MRALNCWQAEQVAVLAKAQRADLDIQGWVVRILLGAAFVILSIEGVFTAANRCAKQVC